MQIKLLKSVKNKSRDFEAGLIGEQVGKSWVDIDGVEFVYLSFGKLESDKIIVQKKYCGIEQSGSSLGS